MCLIYLSDYIYMWNKICNTSFGSYSTVLCGWQSLFTNLSNERDIIRISHRAQAWNTRDLHRGDLEPAHRDRYQDGNRGRGTDKPQPRRLCNGGSRAGISWGPTDEVNVLQGSYPSSRLLLHSLFSLPLPSSLFFSRGLVFILATSARRMPTELVKATNSSKRTSTIDWRGTSFRPWCHRPRANKQRPRHFPAPYSDYEMAFLFLEDEWDVPHDVSFLMTIVLLRCH